ncbi:MAG: hypothetical protein ACLTCP_08495 [Ruminococcus bicirculans (ex Wegman et al. 2014)]
MSIRTDMAAESFSQAGGAEKLQGVKVKNKVIENARLEVTDITIETQEAAESLADLSADTSPLPPQIQHSICTATVFMSVQKS